MSRLNQITLNFIVLFLGLIVPYSSCAQNHSANLKEYLTDDVIAIVYFDLEKLDSIGFIQSLGSLKLLNEAELRDLASLATISQQELDTWKQAGIQKIYALLRTSDLDDLSNVGTSWVVPLENRPAEPAIKAIRATLERYPSTLSDVWKSFASGDQAVLIAASDSQLARLKTDRPSSVRDYEQAWESIGGGSIGLLLMGDADSRRVLKDLAPQFSAPFERLSGKLLADQMAWMGIQLNVSPALTLRCEFETTDEQARTALVETIQASTKWLDQLTQTESRPKGLAIHENLHSQTDGNRVTISIDTAEAENNGLLSLFSDLVLKWRASAQTTKAQNNLRQLALAMHNYELSNRHFPTSNGKSEKTPAGLSWRVHVLPFLEQGELYREFKLDEPWDSAHNLPLAQRMPEIFQSPLGANRKANQEGRTVYQVPLTEVGIFKPNAAEGTTFRQILDGSSNTILIVSVLADQAVPWTKPADWEVNLENPHHGLFDDQRTVVLVAMADGSAQSIRNSIPPKSLTAWITMDGGEVPDFQHSN